jgi:uncharacterized protein YprB with RNaseH-like and TPR domain
VLRRAEMDLKNKIARLRSPEEASPQPTGVVCSDEKAARLARLKSELSQLINRQRRQGQKSKNPDLERPLPADRSQPLLGETGHASSWEITGEEVWPAPGSAVDTPHGALHLVASHYPTDHCHGAVEVAKAAKVDAQHVAKLALDLQFAEIDLGRALFFDTETTGLAGGTGTLPFLIGLGWFEAGELHVEQLLLAELGRELAMLERFCARLQSASCLVSYNGKSFDWPLVCTRLVLNRLPLPAPVPHLDLLHVARRAFKRRLSGVSLRNVEENVLGFVRLGDIDSAEIPERYFAFLRSGNGALLEPVVQHNRHDVVALAALLVALVESYQAEGSQQDPRDQISLAHVAMRARDPDQAGRLAQKAADTQDDPEVSAEAWVLLAKLHRRRKEFTLALDALRQGLGLVEGEEDKAAYVHLLLAKIYEHDLKDYRSALAHAEKTLAVEGEDLSRQRISRLRRRCGPT